MSRASSPGTGKPYGLARVSRVWRANWSARDFDELPDRRNPSAPAGSARPATSIAHRPALMVGKSIVPSLVVVGFDRTIQKYIRIASMAFGLGGWPSAIKRAFASGMALR